jgi:non-ribosomal peptide synthase protein (TIGR01720 family)
VLSEVVGDEGLREAGARLSTESVEFNYLGQFDGTLNETTAFRAAKEPAGASSAAANPASAPVSVNAIVHDGCLQMTLVLERSLRNDVVLATSLRNSIGQVIAACLRQSRVNAMLMESADDCDEGAIEEGIEI